MSEASTVSVPVSKIGIRRAPGSRVAVIGIPNAGKSTLFNRLTGMRQTTANYPGVTVEKRSGIVQLPASACNLVDLPGIFCLGGASSDERIAVDVLLGRMADIEAPDAILFVLDATHLYQGLYLLQQVLEIQLPVLVALTMSDAAAAQGLEVDTEALEKHLGGVPVVPVVATTGRGIADLKDALEELGDNSPRPLAHSWPELSHVARQMAADSGLNAIDIIQALIHPGSHHEAVVQETVGGEALTSARAELFGDEIPQAEEARHRYAWVRGVLPGVERHVPLIDRLGAKILRWINRPWPATLLFFAVMALVFQAVFSWATPMMDAIDAAAAGLGELVRDTLPEGMLASFLADGIIAGVGSVVIFLPQILILFTFIIVLEDSGFLARTAYLMDRIMRTIGLSGQSVIPMISSFACAVPSIMATRVIPDRRDRIATILAAPFMTCSARLPVYALLIAAFVPDQSVGWFNLQGLVLFGLYMLGIIGGLGTAWLLKRSALRGPKPAFALALPDFRWPNLQTVSIKLWSRAVVFLRRAGTVIFVVAIIVWALAYFPRSEAISLDLSRSIESAQAELSGTDLEIRIAELENQAAANQLEQSLLGRAGKLMEPVFRPLGWDWRISAAVIAGFPAREVVVAVMGTIYAVGSEAEESTLVSRLRSATWPDDSLVFSLPMVLGLLVFYAWCLQCAATVAVIRRETNSWRWPVVAWSYMTVVGYLGALLIYQFGRLLL